MWKQLKALVKMQIVLEIVDHDQKLSDKHR